MKKFLMTIVAAVAAVSVNAQVYVGGTLNFKSADTDNNNSTTTFVINPEIGYVLNDNWSLGISLAYGSTDLTTAYAGTIGEFLPVTTSNKLNDTYTMVAVNPYVRYTFLKAGMVNLFMDGGFSFANLNDGNNKVNSFNIGIQPGVAVNLNEKISFVAKLGQIGYTTAKGDWDNAKAQNSFDFNVSSLANLQFGMYYNF